MEIRCRQLPHAIADVLGGEASPALSDALYRHAAGCAACAKSHRDLANILDRARAMATSEPSPDYWRDFLPALRSRIARGDDPRRSPFAWLRPALAGVALTWLALAAVPVEPSRTFAHDLPLEDLQRLASALDPIASDDESVPWDGPLTLPTTDAGGGPTGDLFAFYELALELTEEQAEALVRALGDDADETKG